MELLRRVKDRESVGGDVQSVLFCFPQILEGEVWLV